MLLWILSRWNLAFVCCADNISLCNGQRKYILLVYSSISFFPVMLFFLSWGNQYKLEEKIFSRCHGSGRWRTINEPRNVGGANKKTSGLFPYYESYLLTWSCRVWKNSSFVFLFLVARGFGFHFYLSKLITVFHASAFIKVTQGWRLPPSSFP